MKNKSKKRPTRRLVFTTSLSYFPIKIYHNDKLIDSETAGGTNYLDEKGDGIIDIDSNLSERSKHEVFVHELIHIADIAYTLNLSERKVTILGHCLAQAFYALKKVRRKR